MNKRHLGLALCAFVITAAASLTLSPSSSEAPVLSRPDAPHVDPTAACSDASTELTGTSDPYQVPPGCCTSNCSTDKDCNRICGKGNCVCIASSDCCRRCTW